jgi:hypothetical protein
MSAEMFKSKPAGVEYHNNNVWQFSFRSEKGMTTKQITKFIRKNKHLQSQVLYGKKKKQKVEFLTTTFLPLGPRSSYFNSFDNIEASEIPHDSIENLGNPSIKHFTIYMRTKQKGKGGTDDEKNDCLYNCMKDACGGNAELLPARIRKASQLKRFLGLKRFDKVPVNKLCKLEEEFNISFTVSGDYEHIAKEIKPQNFNLTLCKEHYKLKCNVARDKSRGMYFKEVEPDKIFSYLINHGTGMATFYNGSKMYVTNSDRFVKEHLDKKFEHKQMYLNCKRNENIIDKYTAHLEMAELLKTETKGFVNMFKFSSVAEASFDVFRRLSKNINEPDPITTLEARWIDKAFCGGMHSADKGFDGIAFSYDMNSMYLSYMCQLSFTIPVKEGKFQYMSQEEFDKLTYYPYGIYICEIVTDHKLFTTNKKGAYTNYDLILCKELGIKVTLVDNEQANCLFYETRINGNKMFGAFAKYMYDLKKRGLPVKLFISSLWGYLCRKNVFYHKGTVENPMKINNPNEVICDLHDEADGTTRAKTKNFDNLYFTDYARLGPFLTSYCRLNMARICLPHLKHIVKINTDSVTTTKDISSKLSIGIEIGQFKIEHENENLKIKNVNSCVWG